MTRKLVHFTVFALAMCVGSQVAAQDGQAEVPRGLWQTEPDGVGIVLHVRTRNCGRSLCGRVERAKNRKGYDAPSGAVGEQVLSGLKPQPDGSFLGEFRDQDANVFDRTRVRVEGKNMRLEACTAQICEVRIWKRVR